MSDIDERAARYAEGFRYLGGEVDLALRAAVQQAYIEGFRRETSASPSSETPVVAAAIVAKRWLIVAPGKEGPLKRVGPFFSKDEAEAYAEERYDDPCKVVEMTHLDTFEAAMSAWLIHRHPDRVLDPVARVTEVPTPNGEGTQSGVGDE